MTNTLSAEQEKLHDEFQKFALGNTFFHGTHNEMVEITTMWWLDKVAEARSQTLQEVQGNQEIKFSMGCPGGCSCPGCTRKRGYNDAVKEIHTYIAKELGELSALIINEK